jgi:nucleoid DNA-binding protein
MAKKKVTKKKAADAKKAPTKGEILRTIAESTGLARKDVVAVFDSLAAVTKKSLRACGQAQVPGMCKLVVKKKPRVPAGPRYNPFTGETKDMPAKPASKTVRARPLKAVKDMV